MHRLVGKIALSATILVSSLVNAQMQHEVEAVNKSDHTVIIMYKDVGSHSSALLHPSMPIDLSIDDGSHIMVMAPNGLSKEIKEWRGGNVGDIMIKTQNTVVQSI